mmetsp:Transcript_3739/g.4314  ORF Transcript_3739/g.4314 Transcript_3739/m.4314 type:complete len:248 (-) Transcript_3739:29-772(-)|eukprot:CAMPEP_0185774212 /NCGR_PEP_ID=MMETSP1174-20130828/77193_1 /TAXON_ID=35687 /ORGANISM="Dictyocha speculum, Strain CCMP1381" /LENGTH=247 /DNA_ID=CAMNT_0028461265 /DNA_START=508 /DNA_END=1251 /DNA_ORIENTATION=-
MLAVDDKAGEVRNQMEVVLERVALGEPAFVLEEVGLAAGKGEEQVRLRQVLVDRLLVTHEGRQLLLPANVLLCGGEPHILVGVGEAPIVSRVIIAAFVLGNVVLIVLPLVGEQLRGAALFEEPVAVALVEKTDPAKDKRAEPRRVCLSVGHRQRAPPAPPQYHVPLVDTEVLAELLDVFNKVPSRVVLEAGVRCATIRTTLVEHDDAVERRVEEAPGFITAAAPGPAMEVERDWGVGITPATLLVVE